MRRTRLFLASLAASAVGLVALAPMASAGTTQIGTPPGKIVHVCLTITAANSTICIDI